MTRADIREQPAAWPSCTLGSWSAAWIAGLRSPDDVITALGASAGHHAVDDHAGVLTIGSSGVLDLLALLREADHLVVRLPDAGDPSGLPPDPATTAAFAAGEVLLVGDRQAQSAISGPLALIPTIVGGSDWSGRDDVICRWAVHRYRQPLDLEVLGSTGPSARHVEYQLREAVRDAAELFAGLGDGARRQGAGDLREQLAALTIRHQVTLPPSPVDSRATRIVDSAARIEAIVDLAVGQRVSLGAAAAQLATVDTEFRRLAVLARTARAAAVNATISELLRSRR